MSAVIAFYPAITSLPDIAGAGARAVVPTLLLSGEQDRYANCCLMRSMQQFEAGARSGPALVTLVSYPNADHGFNLGGSRYRADDAADA